VPGFAYKERLHGGYYLLADPTLERAADLVLEVLARDVGALAQTRTAELHGEVRFEGYADSADAHGKLVLDPEEKRASYELTFTANDGSRCRFRGYKELSWLNLMDSFTLVSGSLYDDTAREMGRAVVRFDLRGDWASLVRSIRLLS